MIETAIIIFREGLEAFLIVAIMVAYVTNSGHKALLKPIAAGVATALALSATTGWHVAELAQDPLWEGTLALSAAVLVASFTLYVMRTAKTIRKDIQNSLQTHAQKEGWAAIAGVFIFTVLMIAREGMETALMLGAMSADHSLPSLFGGAFFGACLVGVIGFLWITQSSRINLRLFMQVTGIFLLLFAVHLFAYGLHELSEMNLIPLIGDEANMEFHIATEEIIEGPVISNFITFGMMAVPLIWLGLSFLRGRSAARALPVASE